jgi:hypothetical protein
MAARLEAGGGNRKAALGRSVLRNRAPDRDAPILVLQQVDQEARPAWRRFQQTRTGVPAVTGERGRVP